MNTDHESPMVNTNDEDADPILLRRAKVSRLVSLGMRVGSALFLVATVLFFVALMTRFSSEMASLITICLIAGSAILAPAMVIKYAVKAADRADREGDW